MVKNQNLQYALKTRYKTLIENLAQHDKDGWVEVLEALNPDEKQAYANAGLIETGRQGQLPWADPIWTALYHRYNENDAKR